MPEINLNILERRAAELLAVGDFDNALRIYYHMADGDPSLNGGHLGARIGKCYESKGELYAAKYWYTRAYEENPEREEYQALHLRFPEIPILDLL